MFTSIGQLKYEQYSQTQTAKLIVEVDQEIQNYYRSLIPKYFRWNPQRYPAHISVVRNEFPPNIEVWNKYQGQLIEFQYDGIIHQGTVYFWLNVYCKRLEEIRLELGLPVSSPFTRPPDTFEQIFHITLANCKKL